MRGAKYKKDQKVYNRKHKAAMDKTEKLHKNWQTRSLLPYDGESEDSRKSCNQKTADAGREKVMRRPEKEQERRDSRAARERSKACLEAA